MYGHNFQIDLDFKSTRGLILSEISYALDESYNYKLQKEKVSSVLYLNDSKLKSLKSLVWLVEGMAGGLEDFQGLDSESHLLLNCLGPTDLVNMNNLRTVLLPTSD